MASVDAGDLVVTVRRQWNDDRKGTYRFDDIENIEWSRVSGGIQAPAPQPFLHGYVKCDAMLSGELAHSAAHGSCPHRIKVCIVKKDNPTRVFEKLVAVAGPKPQ